MPKDTVVVNTTPLISLALLDHITLLHQLYQEILIPDSVAVELKQGGVHAAGSTITEQNSWIRICTINSPEHTQLLVDLDTGEADVIELALERKANRVIIDEQMGRWYANRLGMKVTGTIGILLKAKETGLISSIAPLLNQLKTSGIWLSDDLIKKAVGLAGEK